MMGRIWLATIMAILAETKRGVEERGRLLHLGIHRRPFMYDDNIIVNHTSFGTRDPVICWVADTSS